MMFRPFICGCLFLLLFSTGSGSVALGQETPGEPVLARAGDRFVTEREFLERFEMTPGLYRHRKPQLEQEKLNTLYSLVAEKLLAQEAVARGCETDTVFQQALHEVTKLLARDELYRQEVRRAVTISPEELRQGMQQARQERRVRYIFSPDSTVVAFLRSRIRSTRDLDRIKLDSTLGVTRDTATIVWGDADSTIERMVYALQEGTVSSPIRAGDGWYLLRLLSTSPSATYSSLTPFVLRERVTDLLRQRKERRREEEFVRNALQGMASNSPPALYRAFASELDAVFRLNYEPPSTALSPQMGDRLRERLQGMVAETLITAGSAAWSVGEVIDRLILRGFTVSGDSVRGVAHRLYTVLQEFVRQELLGQEALRRGLDAVPQVRAKLVQWRDHYLAGIVRRRLNASIRITDGETYSLLRQRDPQISVPEVQIRELRARRREDLQPALDDLKRGVSFDVVARQYAEDPVAKRSAGLSPFFPISERTPLGLIAMDLDTSEVYGPLRDSTSYLLLQCVAKRNVPSSADTAAARRMEEGRADLRRMKERRMATLFIAQSARTRGVEVFSERLRALQVSTVPMLAYRFLGFGGRMFEVPFVEPQLDWLDTEPPRETILP